MWKSEQHKKTHALGTTRAASKAKCKELQRLRREHETLRQGRDFLRSAAAYFAKERK
jgi:transposase-like protein